MPFKYSKLNTIEKTAVIAGGAIVGYILFRGIKRFAEKQTIREEIRKYQKKDYLVDIPGKSVYVDWMGKTIDYPPYTVNLKVRADQIYDAFYNNDWFGFTEDEETAIMAIADLPSEAMPKLASIYNAAYTRDLYKDFRRFLDSDDYARISHKFQG